MTWQPIGTAPTDGTEVLLTGDSGYMDPHGRFYINGYRDDAYRKGWWLDATSRPLSHKGWEPTHWMPLPDPPVVPHG